MIKFDTGDLGADEIEALALQLGLDEKQTRLAFNRALRRTATTLRARAARGMKSEFGVRKVSFLRHRMKYMGYKRHGSGGSASMWFGLNDMPVSALQGTKRRTPRGAAFSGKAGSKEFARAFVENSRRGFGRTILVRESSHRLPVHEAEISIHDRAEEFLEDNILPEVKEIFWHYFIQEMKARAAGYGGR